MIDDTKKYIKKSFLGIVLLAISIGMSAAMDEKEPSSADIKKNVHEASEGYKFTDWMNCLGRNTFDSMDAENQQMFRELVAKQADQLTSLIYEGYGHKGIKDEREKIAGYIRQIAQDQNPIGETPLSVKKNKENSNHQWVIGIENVLFKLITGQLLFMNGILADSQILKYLPNK